MPIELADLADAASVKFPGKRKGRLSRLYAEAVAFYFKAHGTASSGEATANHQIDVAIKQEQTVSTALGGDVHFRGEEWKWARLLVRILRSKDPVVLDAIESNLKAFDKLIRVSEQHGTAAVPQPGDDQPGKAGQLPVLQDDAAGRGTKHHSRDRKRRTG